MRLQCCLEKCSEIHREAEKFSTFGHFSYFIEFLACFEILCGRYTSDYDHFIFSDTILPLYLSKCILGGPKMLFPGSNKKSENPFMNSTFFGIFLHFFLLSNNFSHLKNSRIASFWGGGSLTDFIPLFTFVQTPQEKGGTEYGMG